ncbi:MAG: YiaA/YiaB family inner membrane protein [Thermocrispum sp.]
MNLNTSKTTTAFAVQSALSFGLALTAMLFGIAYLPVEPWPRAFLALGVLFLTTSAFALAKVVRDMQDGTTLGTRLDQARVDKILAEHDPFNAVS